MLTAAELQSPAASGTMNARSLLPSRPGLASATTANVWLCACRGEHLRLGEIAAPFKTSEFKSFRIFGLCGPGAFPPLFEVPQPWERDLGVYLAPVAQVAQGSHRPKVRIRIAVLPRTTAFGHPPVFGLYPTGFRLPTRQ